MRLSTKLLIASYSLVGVLLMLGCSPEWFIQKGIKKGAKPQIEYDTSYVDVPVPYPVYDSSGNILRYDTLWRTETKLIPKIEYVYLSKQERKKYKDSLNHAEYMMKQMRLMYEDSLKYAWKNNKVDSKEAKVINKQDKKAETAGQRLLVVLVFAAGLAALMIMMFLRRRYDSKLDGDESGPRWM